MSKTQKNLTITLWALLVVAMLSLVASGMLRHSRKDAARARMEAEMAGMGDPNASPHDLTKLFEVRDFALVDQNGKPVTLKDLKGQVWVADFIFTRCAGICLTMTSHMTTQLQPTLGPAGVKLVSFSVDTQYDTPEILKGYATGYKADDRYWHLLTGDQKVVFDVADGMKLATKGAEGDQPIVHSPMFVLVDKQGWVRGYYDSAEEGRVEKLKGDALKLLAE